MTVSRAGMGKILPAGQIWPSVGPSTPPSPGSRAVRALMHAVDGLCFPAAPAVASHSACLLLPVPLLPLLDLAHPSRTHYWKCQKEQGRQVGSSWKLAQDLCGKGALGQADRLGPQVGKKWRLGARAGITWW